MPPARAWAGWGGSAGSSAGLLLAAALPVFGMHVGLPDDGSLPANRTERRAYDLVAQGFGPGINGPLIIAVDPAGDPGVLDRLVAAVSADPGIASVTPPAVDPHSGIASLVVFPTTGPQEQATADTIARLRADVLRAVVGHGPAQAHIGGAAATLSDVGRRTRQRLPVFIAAVLALSFVLLLLVFRSVLVPLKTVLLNLLSIAAAYGIMVAVFQWGWGGALIGLTETVPIVRGVSGNARIITSAAMIMVAVFLSLVIGPDPSYKMLGLGMATAVFVDATVVRMVLVPATMTLLGRANWWQPRWLDRVLPRVPVGMDAATDTELEPTGTAGIAVPNTPVS